MGSRGHSNQGWCKDCGKVTNSHMFEIKEEGVKLVKYQCHTCFMEEKEKKEAPKVDDTNSNKEVGPVQTSSTIGNP